MGGLTEREQMKVAFDRQLEVYKRDDMVQQGRYGLSVQENRVISFLASKIKPDDSVFEEYTFSLQEFYNVCGIDKGGSYTDVKNILKKLRKTVWWAKLQNGQTSAVSWLEVARINDGTGEVTLGFHRDMQEYLLQLINQGCFYTKYELQYVLPMKSQYSPRLYEILKSYHKNNRAWFFEVEDLKCRLDCEQYKRWPDFRRRALEPAVEEINLYSDIKVAYDVVKKGKKVVRVEFYMKDKSPEDVLATQSVIQEELDGQLSMDDIFASQEDSVRAKFFRED